MRLIDADKLLYEDIECTDGNTYMTVNAYDIDNAPTVNAIIVPKGATNGDIIKALFPDIEVKEKNVGYEVYCGVGTAVQFFNHQWWNMPYKESEVNP